MTRRYLVRLTRPQLDALISLAELTGDGSCLTYSDWAAANPQSMRALRAAEYALRSASEETKS